MLTRSEKREVEGLRLAGCYEAARARYVAASDSCRGYAWQAVAMPLVGDAIVWQELTTLDEPDRMAERVFRTVYRRFREDLKAFIWSFGEVETGRGTYRIGAGGDLVFTVAEPAPPARRRKEERLLPFHGGEA